MPRAKYVPPLPGPAPAAEAVVPAPLVAAAVVPVPKPVAARRGEAMPAHASCAVPGGRVSFYLLRHSFEAACSHPAHGPGRCVMTRGDKIEVGGEVVGDPWVSWLAGWLLELIGPQKQSTRTWSSTSSATPTVWLQEGHWPSPKLGGLCWNVKERRCLR